MRFPNRIRSLLLSALLLLVVPASASAQAAYSSSGSQSSGGAGAGAAQYEDEYGDGNGGGASANDPYYDDSYDEDADNGGQEPSGSLPDPPKAPAKPSKPKEPKKPATPAPAEPTPPKTPTVSTPGTVAQMMSNGKATVPRGAPKSVRQMIVAANRLIGKPYLWGGGHAKLEDKGYDCSGSVSYALIAGGQLTSPLVSGALAKWGAAGAGAWVTVYANKNHVYMEIAGLRFDTSQIADPGGAKGPRWRPAIGGRKGFKVRHAVGL